MAARTARPSSFTTELDLKDDEKTDKNFSKRNLKGQRETGAKPKGVKPRREPTTEEWEASLEREKEEEPGTKEGVKKAKPKKVKPPRGLAAKELGAKLVHERNMDREEVPEINEVIEKEEAREEGAIKGKEEVIENHDTLQGR